MDAAVLAACEVDDAVDLRKERVVLTQTDVLAGLETSTALTDEDRRHMEAQDPGKAWTWRFDELDAESEATIAAVYEQMGTLRLIGGD